MAWLTDNTKIQELEITKAQTIAKDALKGYSALKRLTLGATVQSIGEGAFTDCVALEYVSIPAALSKFVEKAFPPSISITYQK